MLPMYHVDEFGDGPRLNAFTDEEMLFMCRFPFSCLFIFVLNLGLVFCCQYRGLWVRTNFRAGADAIRGSPENCEPFRVACEARKPHQAKNWTDSNN